jgi:hypothetical protein
LLVPDHTFKPAGGGAPSGVRARCASCGACARPCAARRAPARVCAGGLLPLRRAAPRHACGECGGVCRGARHGGEGVGGGLSCPSCALHRVTPARAGPPTSRASDRRSLSDAKAIEALHLQGKWKNILFDLHWSRRLKRSASTKW